MGALLHGDGAGVGRARLGQFLIPGGVYHLIALGGGKLNRAAEEVAPGGQGSHRRQGHQLGALVEKALVLCLLKGQGHQVSRLEQAVLAEHQVDVVAVGHHVFLVHLGVDALVDGFRLIIAGGRLVALGQKQQFVRQIRPLRLCGQRLFVGLDGPGHIALIQVFRAQGPVGVSVGVPAHAGQHQLPRGGELHIHKGARRQHQEQ